VSIVILLRLRTELWFRSPFAANGVDADGELLLAITTPRTRLRDAVRGERRPNHSRS